MERPSRNRKSVNYLDCPDDDDEDFASAKPPKTARMTVKHSDAERNRESSSEVVDLTSSAHRERVSLDDQQYKRDLDAALTLSLLDTSGTEEQERSTRTEDHDRSEAPPPVLTHCNTDDFQPRSDSPPLLSNCSVDGNSLGLNLIISMKTSPPTVSKQRKASEQQRKPLKDSGEDEDYQPQNTPDSESDADFSEEDESEDETLTVKKKSVKKMVQKTDRKTPQAAKHKTQREKTPAKTSKAKTSAPTTGSAASVSRLKTPTTPPLCKAALSSSPAGGRLPKWNPPGLVAKSPGESQNASVKSPGQGLRLGLSRLARVKPLHPNAAAH